MNNEIVQRALAQAREMQKTIGEAVSKASEQTKPMIEESLKNATALQASLADHAAQSGAIAQEQTQRALSQVQEFIRMGTSAMKTSADQARVVATQMVEQSKKTVESATAAMNKKPESSDPVDPPH